MAAESSTRSSEQARRDLRDYVTAWISDRAAVDTTELARLINAAPAKQTLSAYEWWNVALLLAQEIQRASA